MWAGEELLRVPRARFWNPRGGGSMSSTRPGPTRRAASLALFVFTGAGSIVPASAHAALACRGEHKKVGSSTGQVWCEINTNKRVPTIVGEKMTVKFNDERYATSDGDLNFNVKPVSEYSWALKNAKGNTNENGQIELEVMFLPQEPDRATRVEDFFQTCFGDMPLVRATGYWVEDMGHPALGNGNPANVGKVETYGGKTELHPVNVLLGGASNPGSDLPLSILFAQDSSQFSFYPGDYDPRPRFDGTWSENRAFSHRFAIPTAPEDVSLTVATSTTKRNAGVVTETSMLDGRNLSARSTADTWYLDPPSRDVQVDALLAVPSLTEHFPPFYLGRFEAAQVPAFGEAVTIATGTCAGFGLAKRPDSLVDGAIRIEFAGTLSSPALVGAKPFWHSSWAMEQTAGQFEYHREGQAGMTHSGSFVRFYSPACSAELSRWRFGVRALAGDAGPPTSAEMATRTTRYFIAKDLQYIVTPSSFNVGCVDGCSALAGHSPTQAAEAPPPPYTVEGYCWQKEQKYFAKPAFAPGAQLHGTPKWKVLGRKPANVVGGGVVYTEAWMDVPYQDERLSAVIGSDEYTLAVTNKSVTEFRTKVGMAGTSSLGEAMWGEAELRGGCSLRVTNLLQVLQMARRAETVLKYLKSRGLWRDPTVLPERVPPGHHPPIPLPDDPVAIGEPYKYVRKISEPALKKTMTDVFKIANGEKLPGKDVAGVKRFLDLPNQVTWKPR